MKLEINHDLHTFGTLDNLFWADKPPSNFHEEMSMELACTRYLDDRSRSVDYYRNNEYSIHIIHLMPVILQTCHAPQRHCLSTLYDNLGIIIFSKNSSLRSTQDFRHLFFH